MRDRPTLLPQASRVLYRKWRPQTFAEVAGQSHITQTLANAVAAGTVAHAYLFCGPRGTGKTSTARILAKAVNCAAPVDGNPCDQCDFCRGVREGSALDLIEMDAASNRGIDDIRELRERVGHAPVGARYKVYLLDEAHMLTSAASNALLKTLEEPPPYIIFILATTNPQDMLSTITSRCQRFDFRRITITDVVDRLAFICQGEGYTLPQEALERIARQATGSLRDAINLLELVVSHYGPAASLEQVEAALGLTGDPRAREVAHMALRSQVAEGLATIAAVRDDGIDLPLFQKELVSELRLAMLAKSGALPAGALSEAEASVLRDLVKAMPERRIYRALKAFAEADLKLEPSSPLPLELALVASAQEEPEPAANTGPARPAQAARQAPPQREQPRRPPERSNTPQRDNSPPREQRPPASSRPPAPEPREASPQQEDTPPSEEQRLLTAICSVAKRMDMRVGALLNGGHVVEAGDERLVIGFPFPIHVEKARQPDWSKVAHEAAAQILGRSVTVEFVQSEQKAEQRGPRGGHLARAAREMGARPVRGTGGSDA